MSWTEEDNTDVDKAILKLRGFELICVKQLDKIRDTKHALFKIKDTPPKDLDGSELSYDRRTAFKASLISQVDDIVPSDEE